MTSDEFRSLALELPEAVEGSHMKHPDFRVNGRIFATLGYPDENWGMVKLAPEQQDLLCTAGSAFVPVKGAWGRQGCTNVRLDNAEASTLAHALSLAWDRAKAIPRSSKINSRPAQSRSGPADSKRITRHRKRKLI